MHAAFSAITANTGALIAEMGERAAAAAVAEAMLTIEIKPSSAGSCPWPAARADG